EVPHRGGSTRSHVWFQRACVDEPQDGPTGISRWQQAALPLEQSELMPGPWRVIEVLVTPDEVAVLWAQPDGTLAPVGALPVVAVRRESVRPHEALDKRAPNHGITFPQWTPRAALGVWSYRSTVAIRNVTLTPLK